MPLAFITPRRNAALYLGNILLGSCIVWYGLPALGMPAPYWALISLIVIIEPDLALLRANFRTRLINTISGSAVACLSLLLLGASFQALLLALGLAVLVAMLLEHYPANWRLAPVTVVILMSAALSPHGTGPEWQLALLRVVEVLAGSVVALLQTLLYARWLAPVLESGSQD